MLAKLTFKTLNRNTQVLACRYFSSDVAEKSASQAEGGAEWGIKYDDECLKFEKEWKTIAEKVDQE